MDQQHYRQFISQLEGAGRPTGPRENLLAAASRFSTSSHTNQREQALRERGKPPAQGTRTAQASPSNASSSPLEKIRRN